MTTFNLNDNINIVCEWKKTRNGFKHTATLIKDGTEYEDVKICYLNRTWEQYDFQSVLHKLLEKTKYLTNKEKQAIKAKYDGTDGYDGEGNERAMAPLKSIAAISMLGDLMTDNKKDANDWKTRMLKAGLSGKGLIMPEDWNDLSEDEKERRLNGAIKELTSND